MAFYFKGRKRVAKQLERIVRKEPASAREALTDKGANEDGVHEARTSIKKARAVLRLLRAPLDDRYDEENAQLRAVAHALSSLRDADATLDVLARLRAEHPTAVTPVVERTVRGGLRGRKRRAHGHAETVVAWARGMLDRAKGRIPQRIGRVARFANVRAGVVREYREARGHARHRRR
jgi:CHAD domain-containing protein